MKKQIAVITDAESDILSILQQDARLDVTWIPIAKMGLYDLDAYDAFLLLGGAAAKKPVVLPCDGRNRIEAQIAKGKRVFSEFLTSIGLQYLYQEESTRFSRMVYLGDPGEVGGLEPGELLDDQCNLYAHKCMESFNAHPLLLAENNIVAHTRVAVTPEMRRNNNNYTLWIEYKNLMICTFRLCDFIRACFAPKKKWRALVEYILSWVTGMDVSTACLPDHYTQQPYDQGIPFTDQAANTLAKVVRWFDRADMLIDNGKGGVYEGFGTEIFPDGSRIKALPIRDDCVGEVIMLYGMHYLLTGDQHSLEISDNLADFMFGQMQIKDGLFRGMLRWSDTAWGVCYTHDTGRAIYGELLKNLYLGRDRHMTDIMEALDFLIKTTGSDNKRKGRTDLTMMSEEKFLAIPKNPCTDALKSEVMINTGTDTYSLAAMLLLHKLTGIGKYRDAALKGFETLQPILDNCLYDYPECYITGGLCSKIMPIAWLYYSTGSEKHKHWLYAVCAELQKYRHPNGGYLEWFKGKNNAPAPIIGNEGSLLVENGNPIVDNLYNVNWLSMGFSQAYLVTGDLYFMELWRDIVKYYISMQIQSQDPLIDGAWPRSSDMELLEVYGIPNDVGWGPWAIETGWTMGPIGAGIAVGLQMEELRKYYK